MVFPPNDASCIGVFNPLTESFRCVNITTARAVGMFFGAAVAGNGLIVLAPHNTNCVGTYDVVTDAFSCTPTPSNLRGDRKFDGAASVTTADLSLVVFAPKDSTCVGTFDAVTKLVRCVEVPPFFLGAKPVHSFAGAVEAGNGLVVFAPHNARCVGVFNVRNDSLQCDGSVNDHLPIRDLLRKFDGAAMAGNGLIVFAPKDADCVGTFDVSKSRFRCVDIGSALAVGTANKFGSAAVSSSGKVIFAPRDAFCVGVFDAESDTFHCVDISSSFPPHAPAKFAGAAMSSVVSGGLVVFTPQSAPCVGAFSLSALPPMLPPSPPQLPQAPPYTPAHTVLEVHEGGELLQLSGVQVVDAKWGCGDFKVDVTARVEELVTDDGSLTLDPGVFQPGVETSSRLLELFGEVDGCEGQPKTVWVVVGRLAAPPSLPPGAVLLSRLTLSAVLDGDLADFDQLAFQSALAMVVDVASQALILTITEGSVVIEAHADYEEEAEANLALSRLQAAACAPFPNPIGSAGSRPMPDPVP